MTHLEDIMRAGNLVLGAIMGATVTYIPPGGVGRSVSGVTIHAETLDQEDRATDRSSIRTREITVPTTSEGDISEEGSWLLPLQPGGGLGTEPWDTVSMLDRDSVSVRLLLVRRDQQEGRQATSRQEAPT